MDISDIDNLREDLTALVERYPGKAELRFRVLDPELHANVLTRSRKYHVNASSIPFVSELEAMQAANRLDFSINGRTAMVATTDEEAAEEAFAQEEME